MLPEDFLIFPLAVVTVQPCSSGSKLRFEVLLVLSDSIDELDVSEVAHCTFLGDGRAPTPEEVLDGDLVITPGSVGVTPLVGSAVAGGTSQEAARRREAQAFKSSSSS